MIHNAYRESRDGDYAMKRDVALLRSREHEVETYFWQNDRIKGLAAARAAMPAL